MNLAVPEMTEAALKFIVGAEIDAPAKTVFNLKSLPEELNVAGELEVNSENVVPPLLET